MFTLTCLFSKDVQINFFFRQLKDLITPRPPDEMRNKQVKIDTLGDSATRTLNVLKTGRTLRITGVTVYRECRKLSGMHSRDHETSDTTLHSNKFRTQTECSQTGSNRFTPNYG